MAIGIPGVAPEVFFPETRQGDFPPFPAEDGDEWWAGTAAAFAPFVLAASVAAASFSSAVAQRAGNQDPPDFVSVPVSSGPAQGQILTLRNQQLLLLVGRGSNEDFVPFPGEPELQILDDVGSDGPLIIWPVRAPTLQPPDDDFATPPRALDDDLGPRPISWAAAPVILQPDSGDEVPAPPPVLGVDEDYSRALVLIPSTRLWLLTGDGGYASALPGLADQLDVPPPLVIWPATAAPPLVLHQDEVVTPPAPLGVDEDQPLQPFIVPPDVVMVAPWSFGAAEDVGWTPEVDEWIAPVVWPAPRLILPTPATDEIAAQPLGVDEEPWQRPIWWPVQWWLPAVADAEVPPPPLGIEEDAGFPALVWPVVPPVRQAPDQDQVVTPPPPLGVEDEPWQRPRVWPQPVPIRQLPDDECPPGVFVPVPTCPTPVFSSMGPVPVALFDTCGDAIPERYEGSFPHEGILLYGDGAPLACVAAPSFGLWTASAPGFSGEGSTLVGFFDTCGDSLPIPYEGLYAHEGTTLYGGGAPLACVARPSFSPTCA